MAFGTAEDVAGGEPSMAAENATTKYLMRAWTALAKDPQNGLEMLGWPLCDRSGKFWS